MSSSTRIDEARAAMAKRIPKDDKEHTMDKRRKPNHLRPARDPEVGHGRQVVDPAPAKHGDEEHPAWALIGASRVSHSPPGAVLFDSELRHQHYVVITLRRATRSRLLYRDRLHGTRQMVQVALSEAQWASFVSSMNNGEGVACTLLAREGDPLVPGMPYAPRLRESVDEVRGAADKALAEIRTAFAAVKEKPIKANIRALEAKLANATPNIVFAADSLTEHTENVVQKARADIEAFVVDKAAQLGLEPGDLMTDLPALGEGDKS